MIELLMGVALLGADTSNTTTGGVRTPRDDDAALALAQSTRDRVLSLEEQLVAAIERLRGSTDQLVPGKLAAERTTVADLRTAIKLQLALAQSLDTNFAGYAKSATALGDELARGPERFKQAAELFRRYAKEEEFGDLKSDYQQLAALWDKAGDTFAARAKRIAPEIAEMRQAVKYVQATAKFLGRLDQHLAVHDGLGSGVEREKYIEQLRLYVKSFEEFRLLLKKALGKLAEEPKTTALKAKIDGMLVAEERRSEAWQAAATVEGWQETKGASPSSVPLGAKQGVYVGAEVRFYANGRVVGSARVVRADDSTSSWTTVVGASSEHAFVHVRTVTPDRLVAYVAACNGVAEKTAAGSKQVSFRVDGPLLQQLEERAQGLGVGLGVCARQLIVDALAAPRGGGGPVAGLGPALEALAGLRRDLATTLMVLLADAGKAEPEEARAFVKAQFGIDPSEPPR